MSIFDHLSELALIMIVALMALGPKRFPKIGKATGQTFESFQRAMKEVTEIYYASVMTAMPFVQKVVEPKI